MEKVVKLFEEAIAELELLPSLARGKLDAEELELFDRKKESLHATLDRLRKHNQPEIKIPTQQLNILSGLAQTVLKWGLGEKLFVEYWDKLLELQEELVGL